MTTTANEIKAWYRETIKEIQQRDYTDARIIGTALGIVTSSYLSTREREQRLRLFFEVYNETLNKMRQEG